MKKPAVVFLMETMIDNNRVEAIRAKMKYEGLFAVAGLGHGGGLALLWKHTNTVQIKSYSKNHIDTEISWENMARWRLTCYYGHSERTRRRDSWSLLRELANQSSLPWAVMGDFNDMLLANEKRGQHMHPVWLLNGFRDALFDCGISDLDMEGHPFTWEKSRGTERWVEERLDRVCVNDSWRSLFPLHKVVNLIAPTSDHSAIYLQVHVWRPVQRGCRFRFENAWLREEGCGKVVEDCWKNNGHLDIFQKIEVCANELTSWGKKMVSQFEERIKQCRQRMDRFKGHSDAFSV